MLLGDFWLSWCVYGSRNAYLASPYNLFLLHLFLVFKMYVLSVWGMCKWLQFPWRPEEGVRSRELKLQAFVRHPPGVLGTELRSSVRTVYTLNYEPLLRPLNWNIKPNKGIKESIETTGALWVFSPSSPDWYCLWVKWISRAISLPRSSTRASSRVSFPHEFKATSHVAAVKESLPLW